MTLAFTEAVVAPGNITTTAVDSAFISVKWEGLTPCRLVNGLIVEYRVQYEAQSGGVMGSKEVSGNWSSGGETDLTGLTPSTNYSIAVAAVNEQGTVGLYSDTIVIETLPGPPLNTETNPTPSIECKLFVCFIITAFDFIPTALEASTSDTVWWYIFLTVCVTVLIILAAITITFSLALYHWRSVK